MPYSDFARPSQEMDLAILQFDRTSLTLPLRLC